MSSGLIGPTCESDEADHEQRDRDDEAGDRPGRADVEQRVAIVDRLAHADHRAERAEREHRRQRDEVRQRDVDAAPRPDEVVAELVAQQDAHQRRREARAAAIVVVTQHATNSPTWISASRRVTAGECSSGRDDERVP